MRRVLAPLLLALALLAPPAWSGEPRQPPPIDPAEVGRLLLSEDDTERARGTRLLQARIARGGDLTSFLAKMAQAQTTWAQERLVKRYVEQALRGTAAEQEDALRVLGALGEDAMRTYLLARAKQRSKAALPRTPAPAALARPEPNDVPLPPPADPAPGAVETPVPGGEVQTDEAPLPPQSTADAAQEQEIAAYEGAPLLRLVWSVIEVPVTELQAWLDEEKDPDVTRDALRPIGHGLTVVLGREGRGALRRAETLPEARSRQDPTAATTSIGREIELVPGTTLRYRCCVTPAGKGGWGVTREELRRGLAVKARLEPRATGLLGGLPYQLILEVRHTEVPLPMPVETVRPASNVEPLELDRPEWQIAAAVAQAEIAVGDDGVVVFVPGVVPDKVVVIGARLRPFDVPQAAARGQQR